jgi:hypothetical protein
MKQATPLPISQQIAKLMEFLAGVNDVRGGALYNQILEWVLLLPPASRPPELLRAMQHSFHLTDAELSTALDMKKKRIPDFMSLVPAQSWLADYMLFTLNTEPPDVFHFFAGCVAIGSVLGRNVYYDKGAYQIYPNLAVLIVAPSGKCRKTSACNVAMSLLRKGGGTVLADKATPEALTAAFQDKTESIATIYAPEFAVFLGKQKYQEGMIPLLTALFDCPKEFKSVTITRGEVILYNAAFSMLACSTMDWIQTAIPRDAFGGGFMSRLLFVIQHDTPRIFPRPPAMNKELESRLVQGLRTLSGLRGEFHMTAEGEQWYDNWYLNRGESGNTDKQFAGYSERKPDHLIRLAMILSASGGSSLVLTPANLKRSLQILEWLELFLPGAFGEMNQNAFGEDQSRLLTQLKRKGGKMLHSDWLRLNSNRMRQREFRELMETLKSAGLVEYDAPTHTYFLTTEGWAFNT